MRTEAEIVAEQISDTVRRSLNWFVGDTFETIGERMKIEERLKFLEQVLKCKTEDKEDLKVSLEEIVKFLKGETSKFDLEFIIRSKVGD